MGDLCSHNRAVGGTEKRREGEEKERIRKLLLLPLAFCLQFHNIIYNSFRPVQSVRKNRHLILFLKNILCHLAYTIFMCDYSTLMALKLDLDDRK